MNLQTLASHTVDLDLLPEAPIVLDAGCRWFDFTTALQIRRKDARVIAIDPAVDDGRICAIYEAAGIFEILVSPIGFRSLYYDQAGSCHLAICDAAA